MFAREPSQHPPSGIAASYGPSRGPLSGTIVTLLYYATPIAQPLAMAMAIWPPGTSSYASKPHATATCDVHVKRRSVPPWVSPFERPIDPSSRDAAAPVMPPNHVAAQIPSHKWEHPAPPEIRRQLLPSIHHHVIQLESRLRAGIQPPSQSPHESPYRIRIQSAGP